MLASAVRTTSRRGVISKVRSFASVVDAAGFKVAAVDNGQSTTSITFLVKAGSRYENKAGVAHALKNFGFKVCDFHVSRAKVLRSCRILRSGPR